MNLQRKNYFTKWDSFVAGFVVADIRAEDADANSNGLVTYKITGTFLSKLPFKAVNASVLMKNKIPSKWSVLQKQSVITKTKCNYKNEV